MSKSFTMVFYEVQNEQKDFHIDPTDKISDSDSEQQQQSASQHPNAFILSVPIQNLTFKILKQRFPWEFVQRYQKKNRSQYRILFKIKQINKKIDNLNVWLNLTSQEDKVPLYDGDNMVFVKLRPF